MKESGNIIRVFPRKTRASPVDPFCFFGPPPAPLFIPEAKEVHVSVTFSEDVDKARELAYQWEIIGLPVKVGGRAMGTPGAEFTPGMYLKPGYVITSRGCPNRCWFCQVRRVDTRLIELPITEGHIVLDDNLLACSESHIRNVFAMLERQPEKASFKGGLEAARITDWHVDLLVSLRKKGMLESMYFALDTPDDEEPLRMASSKLQRAGFTRHFMACYCLMGYKGDTLRKAENRLKTIMSFNMRPFAMLYNGEKESDSLWQRFQRNWVRPDEIYKKPKREASFL